MYLHGGDFFDKPDIADNVAGTIGELYREFPKKVVVIAGNHDIRGNNLSTLYQTKLGLLGRLGIVKLLSYGEKIIIEKDGLTVQVTGSPSDFGISRNKEMFILKEKEADVAVHVAHAMILRSDASFGDYVPLSDIQDETVADVTFSGDFHLGFEPLVHKGKYFINPGALVRKYNFLEEINRTPQVCILTVNDDRSIEYELIPLQCAEKGEDVLDRSTLVAKKQYEEKLLQFKEGLLNRESAFSMNLNDVIMFMAKQEYIEEEILMDIVKRIESAEKVLKISEELGG